MWHTKTWKLNELDKYNKWMDMARGSFEIEVLFINNGYAVRWRKFRIVY